MRYAYVQNEVLEQSTDLLETSDAVRDWCWDGDGKGAVMLRFPELTPPTKPVARFVDDMDTAGVEVIPVARIYPPSNQSAMAHLSTPELITQLRMINQWAGAWHTDRRLCLDFESYDKTSWQSCEDEAWADDVLQMLANELYGAASLVQYAGEFAMPTMSTNIGKLCYAMHPGAKDWVGWFERYKARRKVGTTAWQPIIQLQVGTHIPQWYPLSKVTIEAFYASSDNRVVPGGSWEYMTWPMNDPKLVNTEGRKVLLYVASPLEKNPDSLVACIRQVRS